MYIGELSKRTGLSLRAIRLYEEKGLIQTVQRKGRYRIYSDSDVDLLNLISEAKSLGITLAQLKTAIVYKDGKVDWSHVSRFLGEFQKSLESEIARLNEKVLGVKQCISEINSCE
jgi:MerR family copper efflux transcriptional regulator